MSNQYKFALEILDQLAKGQRVDKAVFNDLAVKYEVVDHKYVQGVLEYDGYINEHKGTYRFNSPILKAWWFINVTS